MADVTSTLTTVLRVTGAGQMAATFAQVSQLATTFAGAELALAAANLKEAESAAATAVAQQVLAVQMVATASTAAEMKIAMWALTAAEDAGAIAADGLAAAETAAAAAEWAMLAPIGIIVLAIVTLTAAIATAVKGLQTFAEESKAAFQAAVVFKNLGLSTTPQQLRGQVDAASRATGFQRPALLAESGRLAAAGLQPEQIQKALKVIGDTARATGKDFDEVGGAVEKGVLGKMRGMAQFGIVLQDTGSKAANFARIMQQLNLRFEGASEAFKNTLPFAVDNFQRSLRDLFSVIGEQLAPATIKVLNSLASFVDFIADHIGTILTTMMAAINPLLGLFAAFGGGGANPMSKVGHGGDPATERTAAQIADNTKKMADSVEQAVLGGAGTEVRSGFGHLQARMAMAI